MLGNSIKSYDHALKSQDLSIISSSLRGLLEDAYKEIFKVIDKEKFNIELNKLNKKNITGISFSKRIREELDRNLGDRTFTSLFNVLSNASHGTLPDEKANFLLAAISNQWKSVIFYIYKYLNIRIKNYNIDIECISKHHESYYNKIAEIINKKELLTENYKTKMSYVIDNVKPIYSNDYGIFFENTCRMWYQKRGNKSTKTVFYSTVKLVNNNMYSLTLNSVNFKDSSNIKFLMLHDGNYHLTNNLLYSINRNFNTELKKGVEFTKLSEYLYLNSISLYTFFSYDTTKIKNLYNKVIKSDKKNSNNIINDLLKINESLSGSLPHVKYMLLVFDQEIHDRFIFEKLNDNSKPRKKYGITYFCHTGVIPFDKNPMLFCAPGSKLAPLDISYDIFPNTSNNKNDIEFSTYYFCILEIMSDRNSKLLLIDDKLLKELNNKISKFDYYIEDLEKLYIKIKLINEIKVLMDPYYKNKKIVFNKKYLSITEHLYESDSIFNKISNFSNQKSNINPDFVDDVIEMYESDMNYQDIDENKINALNILKDNSFLLISGPAGTGKTTLLKYISILFDENNYDVYAVCQTNVAKENLRSKVLKHVNVLTISNFVNNYNINFNLFGKKSVLIIDESGVVSNNDLNKLLKSPPDILIVTGDHYQLSSIDIGNWFEILTKNNFMPKIELEKNYRAKKNSDDLNRIWDFFRKGETDKFISLLSSDNFIDYENNKPFNQLKNIVTTSDSAIVSLSYSGIFGVNNCNYVIQSLNNPNNHIFDINGKEFKNGDNIVFDTNCNDLYYNNLKGNIIDIKLENNSCYLIVVETKRNIDLNNSIIYNSNCSIKSVVENDDKFITEMEFRIDKYSAKKEEGEFKTPFHVSYASSIHKSQGLEYDSVIIVTSPNLEDMTFNTLYTALTRCKNNFKILGSQENFKSNIEKMFKNNEKNEFLLEKVFKSKGEFSKGFQ